MPFSLTCTNTLQGGFLACWVPIVCYRCWITQWSYLMPSPQNALHIHKLSALAAFPIRLQPRNHVWPCSDGALHNADAQESRCHSSGSCVVSAFVAACSGGCYDFPPPLSLSFSFQFFFCIPTSSQNPMMQHMMQTNPMIRNAMNNPEVLRQFADPQRLRVGSLFVDLMHALVDACVAGCIA